MASRFYLLHMRIWELAAGGMLAAWLSQRRDALPVRYAGWAIVLLVVLIGQNVIVSAKVPVQLTAVVLSLLSVLFAAKSVNALRGYDSVFFQLIRRCGVVCYSVFVWHQVVFSFYRYIVSAQLGVVDYVVVLVLSLLLSLLSYRILEKGLLKAPYKPILVTCAVLFVVLNALSLKLYANAGVVRNVPELDIYTDNIHRGMHAEYCDRVYKMDTPYKDNGKVKIFACGNSFVRDWVNILMESPYADEFDIVYVFGANLSEKDAARIAAADYVFVNAQTKTIWAMPDVITSNIRPDAQLIGISVKAYGDTNGNLYNRRSQSDYYDMLVSYQSVADEYHHEQQAWGDDFIDMLKPVEKTSGMVQAFTDNRKYISQDCRHLTQAGAQYYSRILDIERYTHK